MVFKPLMKLNKRQFWVAASICLYGLTIWYCLQGKNFITGNSFFWVSLRKTEIGEKQCWYNPDLECEFVQVVRQWSQHVRSEFLICWNEPALFVLSVCFMQFKEWVYLLTWFYLLIPGAVWRTQSLDARFKFLWNMSKKLRTVPNSLRTKNC